MGVAARSSVLKGPLPGGWEEVLGVCKDISATERAKVWAPDELWGLLRSRNSPPADDSKLKASGSHFFVPVFFSWLPLFGQCYLRAQLPECSPGTLPLHPPWEPNSWESPASSLSGVTPFYLTHQVSRLLSLSHWNSPSPWTPASLPALPSVSEGLVF